MSEAGAKGVPFVTAFCIELVVLYRQGGTGIAFERVDTSFSLKSGCCQELR
jgi:hypothetical protein